MSRSIIVAAMLLCNSMFVGAENISLSGNVVEKGTSTGIADVTLTLSNNSQATTTTGSDGTFAISSTKAVQGLQQVSSEKQFTLNNNRLVFSSASSNIAAKVDLFAGNGKKIASLKTGNLSEGAQSVVLPKLSSGINFIRVTIGNETYTGTLYSLGKNLSLKINNANVSSGYSLSTQASAASASDTIIATKAGYLTKTYALSSYTQSGITIEMEEDTSYSDYTDIYLLTDSIVVTGSGAAVDGTVVTIYSAGTYNIHGTLTDGRIIVSTSDTGDVILRLNTATVSNSTTSPFYIESADNAIIELASGSTNSFSDPSNYTAFDDATDSVPNATIFSKDELTIRGTGSLTIKSNYNDALTSKDGLTITGGNITVNSVDDGIRGKDYLIIQGGTLNITTSGDGIKSTDSGDVTTGYVLIEGGVVKITAAKDGIQAENYVKITGGDTIKVTTGGGSSYSVAEDSTAKAIKANLGIQISGGNLILNSADDAIHSDSTCEISGGTFTITSSDDGIVGYTSLTISGGTIDITSDGDGLKSTDSVTTTAGYVLIKDGDIGITAQHDGIQGLNYVSISGGTLTITTGGGSSKTISADSTAKGIKGANNVQISGGTFTISSADDGVHSNGNVTISGGTFTISVQNTTSETYMRADAIHADSVLTIDSGDINITKCYEGLEGWYIYMNGGKVVLVSSDDGVNAAGGSDGSGEETGGWGGQTTTSTASGDLYINGGYLAVYASGDGLDANGNIEINGGTTLVHGPEDDQNGVFDIGDDGSCTFNINGGFVLGAGSSGMAISPSTSSKQKCLTATFTQSQNANTLINLQNSSKTSLFTFSPAVTYGYVVFSSSSLVSTSTYTFYYGGSVSNGTKEDGLYSSGTYTAGTALSSGFSVSSTVTSIGSGNQQRW